MQLETAVSLIDKGIISTGKPQSWMDLGAGTGLFTKALASLLPAASSILAVDKDAVALHSIILRNEISLHTLKQDFTSIPSTQQYDGILMANSLHYVSDALNFLQHLKSVSNKLIIIEYNRRTANTWVPYPIEFEKLEAIGIAAGFQTIVKLSEVPSVYDSASIYSAVLS